MCRELKMQVSRIENASKCCVISYGELYEVMQHQHNQRRTQKEDGKHDNDRTNGYDDINVFNEQYNINKLRSNKGLNHRKRQSTLSIIQGSYKVQKRESIRLPISLCFFEVIPLSKRQSFSTYPLQQSKIKWVCR